MAFLKVQILRYSYEYKIVKVIENILSDQIKQGSLYFAHL